VPRATDHARDVSPPDLSHTLSVNELLVAIAYYAQRASLVNPNGSNRRALRKLLREYDLTIAHLLLERKP
jgi:hypothetical protein